MKTSLVLTSLIPFSLIAAPPPATWINTTSSNWNVAGNWSTAAVPNAQDQEVNIGNPAPTVNPLTITQNLGPTATLGILNLTNNLNANGYVIAPSSTNSLTFNVSSSTAAINVPAGNTASYSFTVPFVLSSDLVITQNDNVHPLDLSCVISGSGSITTLGTGTVVLAGANTFTGGLTISSGTVQTELANTLPATISVNMNGGTLFLDNNSQTIAGIAGSSNIILGSATLTINTTAANTYSGQITGTGGLTVGGTGSLILTNTTHNYALTTVTGGTLQLGNNNAIPSGGDVTLTGGTLNLNGFNQSVGNLSASGGSLTLNGGTLSIALSASQNFAGVIGGSGAITFNGNGFILSLGAAQTYTAPLTIGNGTLQLNVVNALPSTASVIFAAGGILNLNNNSQNIGTLSSSIGGQVQLGSAQLTMDPTAAASFDGIISGTGSVVYQGPFTWILQAAQTYTGGTTIDSGTIQMGIANALASTGSVTVNALGTLDLNNNPLAITSLAGGGSVNLGTAALTLNTTGSTTFSGNIGGGGGSLIVQGNGTQILLGTNSYSGGTTVGGTATLEGTTNSLQGAIVNNSVLFFNQTFNGTYAGPLSGAGALRVGGGGIVTLTGTPSQNSVEISSGRLNIAAGATLTAPTLTVDSGGILGGDGAIIGNITNQGTINPGSVSLEGTLTVNGNVTFQAGSTMVADVTPTASDQLNVTGLVTIQPGSQIVVNASRGEYEEETRYLLIASSQPIVGQFQAVIETNPFLEVQLLYNQILPGSVELDLSIRSLSEVIQGGNAGAIAQCITQANMRRDHDLEQLIADIIFFPVEEVRNILDEMQPSQLRALTVAEQNNALFAQSVLNWRIAEFNRTGCEKVITEQFPWNLWVSLAGNWTDQREADQNVGYSAPSVGFSVGFDGKISNHLFLGAMVQYGHISLDWQKKHGFSVINRMSAGPYLSYTGQYGYLNMSLLASVADFDTKREIPFFDRTASSRHLGETLLPHMEAGIIFHPAPQVSLTPFTMLDYMHGWEDSYQETGAESLNFTIASSTSSLLRSEIGLKISKCAVRKHTKWVHDLKASWVRESRFHGKELTASFRQFPCSFTVEGLYPTRNLLDVGMGLTFIFKQDRMSATLRYEGQFGEGVTYQSGLAQLLTRF